MKAKTLLTVFFVIIALASAFCPEGYIKSKNRRGKKGCILKKCTCKNGEPADGVKCKIHRSRACESCKKGFHLEYGSCIINKCVCEHGIGIIGNIQLFGKSCHNHGDTVCVSCEDGYNLIGSNCQENVCYCENGAGFSGAGCPANGAKICREGYCYKGYTFNAETLTCDNHCFCNYGVANQGSDCKLHKGNSCSQCDDGYYLSVQGEHIDMVALERKDGKEATLSNYIPNEQETPNTPFWPAAPGISPIDDRKFKNDGDSFQEIFCEPKCNLTTTYYNINNNQCESKKCRCAAGVASFGENCPYHMAEFCDTCDYGFTKKRNFCVINEDMF